MARPHEKEETRAARVRFPHDMGRTANDYGAPLFTCTNVIARNALSYEDYSGKWVILRNCGSVEAHFAVSTHDDAAIDPTPTASAAGEEDQTAGRIAAGEVQQRQLPTWDKSVTVYFCRITASGSTELQIEIGEGE